MVTATSTSKTPVRKPEIPEHPDEGCDAWTSCVSCPFPRCRYDLPDGGRSLVPPAERVTFAAVNGTWRYTDDLRRVARNLAGG